MTRPADTAVDPDRQPLVLPRALVTETLRRMGLGLGRLDESAEWGAGHRGPAVRIAAPTRYLFVATLTATAVELRELDAALRLASRMAYDVTNGRFLLPRTTLA